MLKFLLLFLVFVSAEMQEMRPVVVLKQGTITGVKVYLSRVTINAFLGIPYAEPPVGKLRFSVPERHKGWQGTFFAGNYGPLCPYFISNYDMNDKEDCLFLNIWTYAVSIKNGITISLPFISMIQYCIEPYRKLNGY